MTLPASGKNQIGNGTSSEVWYWIKSSRRMISESVVLNVADVPSADYRGVKYPAVKPTFANSNNRPKAVLHVCLLRSKQFNNI
jgi:hypothetical protein